MFTTTLKTMEIIEYFNVGKKKIIFTIFTITRRKPIGNLSWINRRDFARVSIHCQIVQLIVTVEIHADYGNFSNTNDQ